MGIQSYFVGIVGFAAYIIAFLIFLRLPTKLGWFLLEIFIGLIFHVLGTIAGSLIVDQFSYWYATSVYFFLWFCFFFVTSIYSASVSIGIIDYLYNQPEQVAVIDEVYQNCVVKEFEKRAQFLVATEQVQKMNDCYVITPKGRITAQRLWKINQILGLEISPYYSSKYTLIESGTRYSDQ